MLQYVTAAEIQAISCSLLPSLLSPTDVAAASASVVFSNLSNARSLTACMSRVCSL